MVKYGFDGTSSNSYKQKQNGKSSSDEYLFCSSLVPLQLVEKKREKNVIWTNPLPSSTRFCRPIRVQFEKETSELTKREEEIMKDQIKNLKSFNYNGFRVHFKLSLTMIDGKVSKKQNFTFP